MVFREDKRMMDRKPRGGVGGKAFTPALPRWGRETCGLSDGLNVGVDDFRNIFGPVLFFKGKLEPRAVRDKLEHGS